MQPEQAGKLQVISTGKPVEVHDCVFFQASNDVEPISPQPNGKVPAANGQAGKEQQEDTVLEVRVIHRHPVCELSLGMEIIYCRNATVMM